VEDKLSELFERTKLICFVAIVNFFEVGSELSPFVEKAHLEKIKQQKKVKLFTLAKAELKLLEYLYHAT